MIIAKDKTVLQPQVPKAASTGYVVKATHCAGTICGCKKGSHFRR